MQKSQSVECGQRRYTFLAEIAEGGDPEALMLRIHRDDAPEHAHYALLRKCGEPQEFDLHYSDRHNLRGRVCTRRNRNAPETLYLVLDASYGPDYREHFEGDVLHIP